MAKSPSVAVLEKGAEAKVEAEGDEVAVNIDDMDEEQLKALVKDNELEVPNEFWLWELDAMKAFLNENFSEESEAKAPATTADKAEIKAAAAAEKKAKSDAEKADKKAAKDAEKAAAKSAAQAAKDAALTAAVEDKAVAPKSIAKVVPGGAAIPADSKATVIEMPAKDKTKAEDDKAFNEAAKLAVSKKNAGKAVVAVLNGDMEDHDEMQTLVGEIENMKEQETLATTAKLLDQASSNFFKIGGLLCRVQAQGWFKPFASFNELVEQQFGLKARRAGYYMQIYNALAQGSIPFGKVKVVGWTKLAIIAGVITKENCEEWVKIAQSQNALTLAETVKNAKDTKSLTPPDSEKNVVKSITFKPHTDQLATIEAAIEKAKEQGNTEFPTVALEYIAMEYLGTQTLSSKLKSLGIEKAAEIFSEAFPEWDLTVAPVEEDKAA